MTDDEALEKAIALTGVARYRYLVKHQPDLAARAEWAAFMHVVVERNKGQPEYPGLITQAQTFLSTLKQWVRAGAPVASRAERKRRQAICYGCDLYDSRQNRCTKCGCSTALKPWLLTANCPIGKW